MWSLFKLYKIPLLFALISVAFYLSFGYDLHRSDFIKLISLYCALFYISYLLIEKFKLGFWLLASLGILFRFIFIGSIPNLSQDFYRFLWDGRLLIQGISPYLFTPENHIQDLSLVNENNLGSFSFEVAHAQQLFVGMGSLNASHFSNYPPVNQFFFAIAALFAGKSILGSVIILRTIIILADIGILYFGKKLFEILKLPVRNIFWFFLNPFIIIELTGNLHFEGVMLFFFAWGLYLLLKGNWILSAVLIGISISVKLLPLLFLPLFIKHFIYKNEIPKVLKTFGDLFKFYSVIGITTLLTFLPFLSLAFIRNFAATIGLWFQKFEFNASIYYVIRWIGFQIVGWNTIETTGKILPFIVLLFILSLAIIRKIQTSEQLIATMLFAISFYLLLSTTVHSWYVATPLLLSVFTKYKFPIVWSFMVMLSYSAYGKDGFDENLWLITLEYTIVIGFAIWEIVQSRSKSTKILLPDSQ